MFILGLTGAVCSGKTTVSDVLSKFGVYVISADKVAHALMEPGTDVTKQIAEKLGNTVLTGQGAVDRNELFERIKADNTVLTTLEEIIHPAVQHAFKVELRKAQFDKAAFALLEVPLMYESGTHELCDAVAACVCDEKSRRTRAHNKEGMGAEKFDIFNARQMSDDAYREKADYTIDTGSYIAQSQQEAVKLFQALKNQPARAWPDMWNYV